jgi:hypothetical protein
MAAGSGRFLGRGVSVRSTRSARPDRVRTVRARPRPSCTASGQAERVSRGQVVGGGTPSPGAPGRKPNRPAGRGNACALATVARAIRGDRTAGHSDIRHRLHADRRIRRTPTEVIRAPLRAGDGGLGRWTCGRHAAVVRRWRAPPNSPRQEDSALEASRANPPSRRAPDEEILPPGACTVASVLAGAGELGDVGQRHRERGATAGALTHLNVKLVQQPKLTAGTKRQWLGPDR